MAKKKKTTKKKTVASMAAKKKKTTKKSAGKTIKLKQGKAKVTSKMAKAVAKNPKTKAQKKIKAEAAKTNIKTAAIKAGTLGSFGTDIVFAVSSEKIFSPNSITKTVTGSWSEHKIPGKSPKMEFRGTESDEIKMEIVLSAEHGVKPRSTMAAIDKLVKNGTANWFVIGGKVVGSQKMVITKMSEAWDTILQQGELVKATVQLTLKEYR